MKMKTLMENFRKSMEEMKDWTKAPVEELIAAVTTKIAQMANDGLARAIYPAHTQYDGDMIFAISTREEKKADPMLLGTLAADLMAEAIVSGVKMANDIN